MTYMYQRPKKPAKRREPDHAYALRIVRAYGKEEKNTVYWAQRIRLRDRVLVWYSASEARGVADEVVSQVDGLELEVREVDPRVLRPYHFCDSPPESWPSR